MKELIRHRREQLGLTQAQLAHAMGTITPEFISMVEVGKRRFSLDNIPILANALSLDVAALGRYALYKMAPSFYSATYGEAIPPEPQPVCTT
jgi:transcriptional regulator with XRE-family HTH domain